MSNHSPRVLISAGGSGGHLFPMISVAQALERMYPGVSIEFVGTKRGIEARVLPKYKFRTHFISIRGIYRVGFWKKIMAIALFPFAVLKAMLIILLLRPHLVLGSGSYTSGPVMLAALLLGRNTALQEQNASPGFTNRFLGKYVDLALLATEPSGPGIYRCYIVTGNPIREDIHALSQKSPQIPVNPPLVCLIGGSQGARKLNRALCGALPLLEKMDGGLKILHQTGVADYDEVAAAYASSSLDAEVIAFIDDMPRVYREASLIISRAGSGVFEFLAAGKPSILVPIPWSSGGHQQSNAELLQAEGAARLLPEDKLSAESLAGLITELAGSPDTLKSMGANARNLYKGNAAELIAKKLSVFFPLQKTEGI